MAIGDDFEIQNDKDVRYTGAAHGAAGAGYYTALAFHVWLQGLADDASSAGDDFMDITRDTPSDKQFDTIVTLSNSYNIDDRAAEHLYQGSIIQGGASTTIYDGIQIVSAEGTHVEIIQNGNIIANDFWNSIPSGETLKGINRDVANGISARFMLKVRVAGTDTDGRRLVCQTREWGQTYSEFKVNGTSRGINVVPLTYKADLNNTTAEATAKTWTSITNVTEGYNGIDVNNDGTDEYFYSEWNRAALTINQLYERLKWLSARAKNEDSGTDTGSDFAVGNGTITGQAQSFAVGVNAMYLTEVQFDLKKVGSPTGNLVAKLYAHSGTYGSSSVPTGGALATSGNLDVATLTTSYFATQLAFTTQYKMVASTNYVIALEFTGDASNYVHVRGLAATGTHAGNRSQLAGTWSAAATDDLKFICRGSGELYEMAGERFRGITHEITVDTPTGTFQAVEPVSWTGGSGQMLAINSPTAATKMWIQLLTGTAPGDNVSITGGQSSATCLVNVTVTERPLSQPFAGVSTGTALIGAYGLGVEAADLGPNDRMFDLTNTQFIPPNNVTFTVSGVVSGEDYVLVGPASGGVLQTAQFTLQTALTGAAETSVDVNGALPADTPGTGTIRVARNSGKFTRHPYSARVLATGVFTITSADFSTDNASAGNSVFLSYIDVLADATSEAFTTVYDADRTLFVRVRDGGSTPIKTFETTATLGNAGGSVGAVRTSDA